MLDIKRMLASAPHKPEDVELQELFTPWGEALAAGDERQAGPSPASACTRELRAARRLVGLRDQNSRRSGRRMAASGWTGDVGRAHTRALLAGSTTLGRGTGRVQPNELLWYRRTFATPDLTDDRRVILHFEAVDHACACYVNGSCAGRARGRLSAVFLRRHGPLGRAPKRLQRMGAASSRWMCPNRIFGARTIRTFTTSSSPSDTIAREATAPSAP